MADRNHLELIRAGVAVWNEWRENNSSTKPDLNEADLRGLDLRAINLSEALMEDAYLRGSDLSKALLVRVSAIGANLSQATLREAVLIQSFLQAANLSESDLSGAHMEGADLTVAELVRANLSGASAVGANFNSANLTEANLRNANLNLATLVGATLRYAHLTGASVYGTSAWRVDLFGAEQRDLEITLGDEPVVTVDNLEVAQFIYLLLNNQNIRHVIDTITSKVVLILGRFTSDRKAILDTIRDELRKRNYLPVLLDFERPSSRTSPRPSRPWRIWPSSLLPTFTDAKSIPQELMAIVPMLPSVPVQPLLLASQNEYGMFEHFKHYPWVLPAFEYQDGDEVIVSLDSHVIGPAEERLRR